MYCTQEPEHNTCLQLGAKSGFSKWGITGKDMPSEAQRAKSRGGIFGEGQPAPSLPVNESGGAW